MNTWYGANGSMSKINTKITQKHSHSYTEKILALVYITLWRWYFDKINVLKLTVV